MPGRGTSRRTFLRFGGIAPIGAAAAAIVPTATPVTVTVRGGDHSIRQIGNQVEIDIRSGGKVANAVRRQFGLDLIPSVDRA
jgi:hypothetical protein